MIILTFERINSDSFCQILIFFSFTRNNKGVIECLLVFVIFYCFVLLVSCSVSETKLSVRCRISQLSRQRVIMDPSCMQTGFFNSISFISE